MFTFILLLPLFTSIFLFLFSELRPKLLLLVCTPSYLFNIAISGFLLVTSVFSNYAGKYIYVYNFFNWSTVGGVDVGFSIWLDYVSIVMSFTVLLVAAAVSLFSIYYMATDPFIVRFFSYLSLFTFCMLLLVNASDLIQFFLGWELVGLCSYLLINYWYTRKQANIAALKAVLVNRVGDFAFMYAISLIYTTYATLNIYELSWMFLLDNNTTALNPFLACVTLVAVMSKSAQFGLHTWLPDAMEGPTPVSALIHAATMVTAGIFLLLRLANLFIVCDSIMSFISLLGAFTAFFGATTGSAQTDIKKIIAFSTCSQLGYMVASCGLGNFAAAFFHLITHAYFKSLLFLCAGIVIHSLNGEQDMRKMGSLYRALPSTMVSMGIACFALSGVPYFAGFYSKELILSVAFTKAMVTGLVPHILTFSLLVKAAFFTSFYSAKLLYGIFLKPSITIVKHTDGNDFLTTQIPLLVLSIMSLFGGLIFKDVLVGFDYSSTLSIYSDFVCTNNFFTATEYTPSEIKVIMTAATFSGYTYYTIKLLINLNRNRFKLELMPQTRSVFAIFSNASSNLHSFFYNRWYWDAGVSYIINLTTMTVLEAVNTVSSQKNIVNNISTSLIKNSLLYLGSITYTSNNNIQTYIKEYAVSSVFLTTSAIVIIDSYSLLY